MLPDHLPEVGQRGLHGRLASDVKLVGSLVALRKKKTKHNVGLYNDLSDQCDFTYFDEVRVYVVRILTGTARVQHHPRFRQRYDVGVPVFGFGAGRQFVRLNRDHRHVGEFLVDGRPVFREAREPGKVQRMRNGSLEIIENKTKKKKIIISKRILPSRTRIGLKRGCKYVFHEKRENAPSSTIPPTGSAVSSRGYGPIVLSPKTTPIAHNTRRVHYTTRTTDARVCILRIS